MQKTSSAEAQRKKSEFKGLLNAVDWTAREAAKRMHIAESNISRWLRDDNADEIPDARLAHLQSLVVSILAPQKLAESQSHPSRAQSSILQERSGRVARARLPHQAPVVSWAEAGAMRCYEDLPDSQHEIISTDCDAEDCIGVIVHGDSMEPKYSEGDIVVLMPHVEPRNGCLIVTRLESGAVYFKLYHRRGETIHLTSYNPLYPVMEIHPKEVAWLYPAHSVQKNVWR